MPRREPDGLLQQWSGLPLALLVFALHACGGGGSGITFPATTGTLKVTTTTSGAEMDADGYTLQMDTREPEAIGTATSIERTEVQPGDHTLFLGGLSPNCSVGENPRTVRVVAGETLTSTFSVVCSATTGGVVVNTVSGGDSPDADGYSVILDGVDQGPIASTGQASLTGLAPGSHVVGLGGLAGNCQVQGENLRPVTVTPGASATVDYAVSCAAPPPGAGTVRVTTTTSGANPDPDGYSLLLDGGSSQPIAVNTTIPITNVAPGVHTLRLSGIAQNCRVQGANPRPVTVGAGATSEVSFRVSCSAVGQSRIVLVSGNGQTGQVNAQLANPLVVQVRDASGSPIPGITVQWTAEGGGSVSAASTQTGANGQTSVTRTLGPEARQQTTRATAGGLAGSPVIFTHVAVAADNIPPVPAFDPPTCTVGVACQFTDASTDSDGTIVAWVWDFGDTQTSDKQNPTHVYQAAGNYDVTLAVSDNNRTTRQITHQVTVNAPPVAGDDAYTTTAGVGFHAPDDARSDLLANDEDPDADDVLSTEAETKATAQGGSVTIGADGSFNYTTPSEYTGQDSFDYTVKDSRGGSDTGTARIDVQQAVE